MVLKRYLSITEICLAEYLTRWMPPSLIKYIPWYPDPTVTADHAYNLIKQKLSSPDPQSK